MFKIFPSIRKNLTSKNIYLWGRVKMAVWKDAKFTSLHNQGVCWTLVGDADTQGDGKNPPSEPVGCEGTERGGQVEA